LIDAGMQPAEAVAIVRQILEASRFAHRQGIVHRDLTPQNVIVDGEGHATVTDFGIARAGVSEITQTGSVMGTAHYLSPEQAQGLEVTAASDLYSIGVILYEALTGQVPFQGDSAVAVALKQVSQTPQRPSAINPQVSPALDAVVMRALEKSPERRFRDAEAFLAALDAAEREPGDARAQDTAAFAPLPPVGAPAETAAADGAIPPEEEEAERRRRRWIWVAIAALLGLLLGLAATTGIIPEPKTEVPNVTNPFGTNQTLSAAISQLDSKGFDVAEVTRVRRDLPRDTVIEQDPLPGSTEQDCVLIFFSCDKPDVTLTVSAGPGKAEIPQVAGLSQDDATKRLRKADFAVAIETSPSDTVEEGVVISSDPPPGTRAKRGSLVTLTVSSGPRAVKVPVLVGKQRSVAVQEIRSDGLVPSVSERTDAAPSGEVLEQSPSAGTRVDSGSTVSIVVSGGPKQVSIPNVIGKTRSSAVSTLRNKGFDVSVNFETTDVEAQDDRVTDQFPTPGTKADEGSAVTIFVGRFEAPPEPTTTTTTPTVPPG
jgi:beta-lactam-binding protein with PASTA domain